MSTNNSQLQDQFLRLLEILRLNDRISEMDEQYILGNMSKDDHTKYLHSQEMSALSIMRGLFNLKDLDNGDCK